MALTSNEEINRKLVTDAISTPKGYHQITDVSAAVGIFAQAARFALIQAVDQNVRWRDDGTDPTAAEGMLLFAGQTIRYTGDVRTIKFIEVTAGAELNVSLYY